MIVLLSVFCAFSAAAEAGGDWISDDGGFLSQEAKDSLNQKISEVREEIGMDLMVVFTKDPADDDVVSAADRIIKEAASSGLGYGENKDIALFYVDMENRNFRVQTYSTADGDRISQDKTDSIVKSLTSSMADGDYDSAAEIFVNGIRKAGKKGFLKTVWSWLLFGLGGGGIASKIAVGSHNARAFVPKRHYLKSGKLNVTKKEDRFDRTTREVRQIEKSTPSGDGKSSTGHSGSSGSF